MTLNLISAVVAMLAITPAAAATHPNFLPTRDIAARYIVAAPNRPDASYDLQYDAADERARITDPARGLFFIADLAAGTAELVVPALRATVAAPEIAGLTQQIADADDARFTPLGPGRYAGVACEKYLVLNSQGSGTACLTPDGVILHFAGSDARGSASITVTSLDYAPQPPNFFTTPDGYTAITLPPGALQALLGQ